MRIGDAAAGVHTIAEPGEYMLDLLVVAPGGGEYRASQAVRVMKDISPSQTRGS